MDRAQKPIDFECYTASSEPFRFQITSFSFFLFMGWSQINARGTPVTIWPIVPAPDEG
jgi:hypothetical protein